MFQREAKRLKEITHDKSIVATCCKKIKGEFQVQTDQWEYIGMITFLEICHSQSGSPGRCGVRKFKYGFEHFEPAPLCI